MTTQSASSTGAVAVPQESWVPMIAIALGQVLMSFNVASLPVALSGMVNSFGVPPTTVATGIVTYSLAVAGFVMLGAKLNQRFGALHVFRVVVVLFGAAQVLMTLSPNATLMITAQGLSGAAGAALVPSLVALIAENYKGTQQATAVGALGSARAGAGVAAFLIWRGWGVVRRIGRRFGVPLAALEFVDAMLQCIEPAQKILHGWLLLLRLCLRLLLRHGGGLRIRRTRQHRNKQRHTPRTDTSHCVCSRYKFKRSLQATLK